MYLVKQKLETNKQVVLQNPLSSCIKNSCSENELFSKIVVLKVASLIDKLEGLL